MSERLPQALADWPNWPLALTAPPTVIARQAAGRTNMSYRLRAPGLGEDLLLRLHRRASDLLGIDRQRERRICQLTAGAGIGRAALHWNDDADYSLFPYLEARVWSSQDFKDADQRKRLWPLIDRLATLETGLARRRYSAYLARYWRELQQSGQVDDELARGWRSFEVDLESFDDAGWRPALVHHDLIPANVLDTGDRLIVIDWEYAAMGHPEIDRWSIDPTLSREPFIAELMAWINRLWERLAQR